GGLGGAGDVAHRPQAKPGGARVVGRSAAPVPRPAKTGGTRSARPVGPSFSSGDPGDRMRNARPDAQRPTLAKRVNWLMPEGRAYLSAKRVRFTGLMLGSSSRI